MNGIPAGCQTFSWVGRRRNHPQKTLDAPQNSRLTAGEEAQASEYGHHVGDGQQPVQRALRLQQQRRGQPEGGEVGKIIQFGTCGQGVGSCQMGGGWGGIRRTRQWVPWGWRDGLTQR